MPSSGVTKPERGPSSFDGEEPTELMAVPRAPQKTIEMRVEPPLEDEDGPLRKYLAPRLIPTQTVPEAAPADNKIVINVKPAAEGDAAEAEPKLDAERARRRAPTVRIERGTLAAQGMLPTRGIAPASLVDDGIDVSFGDADAEARPSARAVARPKEDAGSTSWKLVLGGVALLLAVVGVVGAILVFTDTIELPGLSSPAPTAEPQAAATAAPTAIPTATAQTSATPAPSVETAAPSAASAVAPPSAATPARPPFQPKPRYTPPPPRTNGRVNPTTI